MIDTVEHTMQERALISKDHITLDKDKIKVRLTRINKRTFLQSSLTLFLFQQVKADKIKKINEADDKMKRKMKRYKKMLALTEGFQFLSIRT